MIPRRKGPLFLTDGGGAGAVSFFLLFFFLFFFRVCITIATGGEAKLSKEEAPAEGQLSHTI